MQNFNNWQILCEARSGAFLWAFHNNTLYISGRRKGTIAGEHDRWVPKVTKVPENSAAFDKILRGHIEINAYSKEIYIDLRRSKYFNPADIVAALIAKYPEYKDFKLISSSNYRPIRIKDYDLSKIKRKYDGD